eukprot:jgi/Tetstr1/436071/TSEL_002665.t1
MKTTRATAAARVERAEVARVMAAGAAGADAGGGAAARMPTVTAAAQADGRASRAASEREALTAKIPSVAALMLTRLMACGGGPREARPQDCGGSAGEPGEAACGGGGAVGQ